MEIIKLFFKGLKYHSLKGFIDDVEADLEQLKKDSWVARTIINFTSLARNPNPNHALQNYKQSKSIKPFNCELFYFFFSVKAQ